jgi:hypothetical protein
MDESILIELYIDNEFVDNVIYFKEDYKDLKIHDLVKVDNKHYTVSNKILNKVYLNEINEMSRSFARSA